MDISFATGACRQEVSEDFCANAARARTRNPRLAWRAPPRLPLPAPPGTTGQRHAVQILHPARAHDPQERAMLAHEAWLARRMRSLRVADHPVLTGKLPYGEVLPYQAGRYCSDATPPSRQNPEVPICMDHVGLKAVARDLRQHFETAEELLLAIERSASRLLAVSSAHR